MIKYISYFILVFCVLYFIKNNTKNTDYTDLITTVSICVGIYIIDLIMQKNIKESFTNKNGDSCKKNNDCKSGYCKNSDKKCHQKIKLNKHCENNTSCKSKHCINRKCKKKVDINGTCTHYADCNNYIKKNNTYSHKIKCVNNKCTKR